MSVVSTFHLQLGMMMGQLEKEPEIKEYLGEPLATDLKDVLGRVYKNSLEKDGIK